VREVRAQPESPPADTLRASPARAASGLAAFPAPKQRAWQIGLLRSDRLEHAGISFTLTAALVVATRDRRVAAAGVLGLGVVKELLDQRTPSGFDPVDLAAGATGIGIAAAAVRPR